MKFGVLLAYARPYRATLSVCAALMLLNTAAALATPWLGGLFAGSVIAAGQADIEAILAVLLLLLAVQAALKFVTRSVLIRVTQRILAELRIRIYDHVQALPISFFHERRQGDLLALMTTEVAHLSGFITRTLVSLAPLLLTALGAVILMARIDPQLGLFVAALVPVFYLLLKILGRRLRPLAVELQKSYAAALAIAEENLGMLPAIKTFTREGLESERHRRQVQDVMRLSAEQLRIQAALEPVIQFLAAAVIVLLLWFASDRIAAGTMTPAELVSFLLYAALLTRPMAALADMYGQMQLARGALERLERVIAETPEAVFAGGRALPDLRGEIACEGLWFAYPGREPALRGLTLHVAAGETLAITGPNGAGKSTLVHLLLRLHEPDAGIIRIDGVDIATVALQSLRGKIGIVPQHVLLLNGSVRDNIGFGRPDATDEAIEAAARTAQAHDFVLGLPQGYATTIGDQGVRLSGGQRQRIALARALLKDPPILILDEPTAMFDPEGERAFAEAFPSFVAGRTVLLITHQAETLALADRIVRLENGAVSEIQANPEGGSLPTPQAL